MLTTGIIALTLVLTVFLIFFKKSKDCESVPEIEQQPVIVNTNNIEIFYPIKFNKKFIKYHKLEKSSYISFKHGAKRVKITEPLFPGDDRERRTMYQTVEEYFKITSAEQLKTINELNMLIEPPPLSIEYYICDEVKHLVNITKSDYSQSQSELLSELLSELYPDNKWEYFDPEKEGVW